MQNLDYLVYKKFSAKVEDSKFRLKNTFVYFILIRTVSCAFVHAFSSKLRFKKINTI